MEASQSTLQHTIGAAKRRSVPNDSNSNKDDCENPCVHRSSLAVIKIVPCWNTAVFRIFSCVHTLSSYDTRYTRTAGGTLFVLEL